MHVLLSERLWPSLADLAMTRSKKRAAIAYVTSDSYVTFGAGDLLVVDAGDAAIAAGQTDTQVLRRAFQRGAELYSYEGLHAKVLVFDDVASVGSANMSQHSEDHLTEACWVSDHEEMTELTNGFIDSLVRAAIAIDEVFLDRADTIEVRPRRNTGYRGPKSYRRERPHPILLFFQEVLPGDVRKYCTESADALTGGGARDLRISPAATYLPILRRMFSTPTDTPGVTSGELIWATIDGVDASATVELWSPTDARPNELRIARFYDVGGWEIDEDQYQAERGQGYHWFYVLELGGSGMVTARLLQQQHFALEDPLVAEHLRAQLNVRQPGHAARGAVDLQQRRRIPQP